MAKAKSPAANAKRATELTISLVGIVVGLAGIYLTLLTFPSALDAVGSVLTGSGLPVAFKGLAGALTLFMVILMGLFCLLALFIGMWCFGEMIFRFLDYPHPRLLSGVVTTLLFWSSTAVTILMFSGSSAIVFGFVSAFAFVFAGLGIYDHLEKMAAKNH